MTNPLYQEYQNLVETHLFDFFPKVDEKAHTLDEAMKKLFNDTKKNTVPEDNSGEIQNDKKKNKILVELFDKVKKDLNEGNWQNFDASFGELEKEIDTIRDK